MRTDLYDKFNSIETEHWWFVARRDILRVLLKQLLPSRVDTALDIGSGPGINLELINPIANRVTCLEPSSEAVTLAREKFPDLDIIEGSFPETLPTGTFDLITMFDALEHIEDDGAALLAAYSLLKKNGHLVITVPCFMFLWSEHDDYVHHKRRYTKRELLKKLKKAGFTVVRATYFNSLLFTPIAIVRLLKSLFRIKTSQTDFDMGSKWLNGTLLTIFKSERLFLNYFNLPIGVSLFCVANKK
jgi:SAM-dependent methyltransferase